jgi:ankyrin repeat protein
MKDMVADLNAKGLDQWSSLHFACDSGHLKIVQELLKQPKIDVEALSTMDRTPLH